MANIDKKKENKQLKRELRQAQRKIEKLLSENGSLKTKNKALSAESKKKRRELILSPMSQEVKELAELLFPDTGTKR